MIDWLVEELRERRDELRAQQRAIALELPRVEVALAELTRGRRPIAAGRVVLSPAAVAAAATASSDAAKPEAPAEIPAVPVVEYEAPASAVEEEPPAPVLTPEAPPASPGTRELVLEALRDRGPLAPRELAEITGKSKPAIASVLRGLYAEDLAHAVGKTKALRVHIGPAPAGETDAGAEAAVEPSPASAAAPSPAEGELVERVTRQWAEPDPEPPAPRPRPVPPAAAKQPARPSTRQPRRPQPDRGVRIPAELGDDVRVELAIAGGCRSCGAITTKLGIPFEEVETIVDGLVRKGYVRRDVLDGELRRVPRKAVTA